MTPAAAGGRHHPGSGRPYGRTCGSTVVVSSSAGSQTQVRALPPGPEVAGGPRPGHRQHVGAGRQCHHEQQPPEPARAGHRDEQRPHERERRGEDGLGGAEQLHQPVAPGEHRDRQGDPAAMEPAAAPRHDGPAGDMQPGREGRGPAAGRVVGADVDGTLGQRADEPRAPRAGAAGRVPRPDGPGRRPAPSAARGPRSRIAGEEQPVRVDRPHCADGEVERR